MSNEAERWGEEMLADLKDQQRQSRRGTVPRAVADRLEASLEEAYSAMGDDSNDFNDAGDGRLMERMRDALDAYRKAVSRGE